MRGSELLRLVWLNINQNKFKTIMTSIGIVVGAATIVMVIAIGRGSRMDVAEQFSNLNAGAIDVSYEWKNEDTASASGGFFEAIGNMFGGRGFENEAFGGGRMDSGEMPQQGGGADFGETLRQGGGPDSGEMSQQEERPDSGEMPRQGGGPDSGEMSREGERPDSDEMSRGEGEGPQTGAMSKEEEIPDTEAAQENSPAEMDSEYEEETESETSELAERMNQENIILAEEDVDDIETYVAGITGATISYTVRTSVEGGNLTDAQTYTVAGVKESYAEISNLVMDQGQFLAEEDDLNKSRVCVLGADVAKELFGSAGEAYESTLYVDDRTYTVIGVIAATGMVSAGITPDEAVFIPYQTGIKYITGGNISPIITVIAEDVNAVDTVESKVDEVLKENYSNAEFTYSDAGSKMEAAESSNKILTMLLSAMAAIVFLVGGIGIMNVLFVSVKERTNEIGILKALGASRSVILFEFLMESAAISLIGGILGVGISFAITPVIEHYGMRVEANAFAWFAALGFAVLTGTLFGIYPAGKAARMVPVEALNAE